MMKKLISLFSLIFCLPFFSQQEDAWLFLKNKPNKTTYIANPLTMLSQRALDRRNLQNISIDSLDVPVDAAYYSQLKNEVTITVLGKSKWLNAVHVQGEVTNINNLLANFNFIERIEFANKALNTSRKPFNKTEKLASNHYNKFNEAVTDFNYGSSDNQIKMLKGDFLHEQGLTGKGQVIAIIDAGFPNVNTLTAFQRIRENNQILGGYNFADRNGNFYTRNSHGTHVLSTIAGYIEDEFVGTAPDAKFYLFISEIAETETVLEETLWVEAAERADSLGVNVINTSLGYTTYDNPNHSHRYADMDGKTTFITRGAEIGASRGLLLVNSAGNSGNDSWKYIGAPADAASVFSIGAVNASENIANFSSFGPTSDNRVKPDVLAKGQGTSIINYITGSVTTSNGTSFSSPVLAGVLACFLEAFPNKKGSEIRDIVRQFSDRYSSPTGQHGYGIPDFEKAYNTVLSIEEFDKNLSIIISPNPVTTYFKIVDEEKNTDNYQVRIFDVLGKKIVDKAINNSNIIDVSFLKKGVFLLRISNQNQHKTIKLIKN